MAGRAKCPKFMLLARCELAILILPEKLRFQRTVFTFLKIMLPACKQPISVRLVFFYLHDLLSVLTARRWLLSAAYTDTKVWEAREKDPQNLGKS